MLFALNNKQTVILPVKQLFILQTWRDYEL